MAETSTENPVFPQKEGPESGEDMTNLIFSKRGCCSWLPCVGSGGGGSVAFWERIKSAENEDRWWTKGWKALKKMKEWSEIMAGPRWKTFLRRFNKNNNRVGTRKFQYDPLSYSLNFDEGGGQNGQDEDFGFRDFSSRYASIPVSAKSSMDLGKDKDTFGFT